MMRVEAWSRRRIDENAAGDRIVVVDISEDGKEENMAEMSGLMTGLNDLRERNQMTWSDREHGWLAAPEAILRALARDGYDECKRETATSHRDGRSAGGLWQGVNRHTGSVAAAIWVIRAAAEALVFIQIDGEPVARPGRERDEEEGGQG